MKNVKITMVFGLLLLSLVWGIVVPSNKSAQSKTYQPNEFDTVQITVHEGWNLISIPLIVPDGRVSVLFPSAISSAFSYEGSYKPCDTLEVGKGYWLKFALPENIQIIGTSPDDWQCVPLQKGWNMIGSIDKNVSKNKIATVPEGILSSKFYEYKSEAGYILAETLRTGKGYWIKVNEPGSFWFMEWMKFLDNYPSSIVIDPVLPNIIYTLERCDFSSNTYGKIMKSTDWGKSWFTILDNVDATGLTIDRNNQNVMYTSLGTNNFCPPGILKTTNAGETWFRADSGIRIDWETEPSLDIINPNNTDILYASTWTFTKSEYYKSTNGGTSWVVLLNRDSLHCGTDSSDIACLLFTGFGMAIDPNNTNVLYAIRTWEDTKLFKSTNGGTNWFVHYIFQDNLSYFPFVFVDPFDSNILYVTDQILYKSTDGGISWMIKDSGLPNKISVIYIIILSKEAGVIYLNYDGKIYKSTNGGNHWILFDSEFTLMQALDENSGFIYARYNGGIYKLKITNCSINK